MSLFKETLRKVPWWAWVFFPIVLVVAVVLCFRKGGGLGALLRPPPREPSVPGPTALDPEQAEEQREEIQEELEAGEKQAETEAEELKRKVREKFVDSE